MAKLKIGSKAPAFSLPDKNGEIKKLSEFEAEYLVVYFYPKDDTPGCTIESKGFSKDLKKFNKLNAEIIGISGGDAKTKTSFCKKYKLKTLLLSDTDFAVSKKYGAYGPKVFMGRKYKGILRNTYILDAKRKVVKIFEKVTPDEHPGEVLEFLKKG